MQHISVSANPNVTEILHTYIDSRIIRQRSQHLVQRLVHLLRRALEEAAAASDEQRVARKDRPVVAVFEEVAYAVLRVARCV